MGLDTHDVGGYPEDGPSRPTQQGRKSLRTARTLVEGMVITVEPGCYFVAPLIEEALKNPGTASFFEKDVMRDFEVCPLVLVGCRFFMISVEPIRIASHPVVLSIPFNVTRSMVI